MHEKIFGAKLPSVMALAYLGDARHSLYIRRRLVDAGIAKSGELNDESKKFVTCEAQAKMLRAIEPYLLEDELDTFKRAANSSHLNKPKRAKVSDYRIATGFEAVIGMLEWIGDAERLEYLLSLSYNAVKEKMEIQEK